MKFQVVNIGLIISLIINFIISFIFVTLFINDVTLGLILTFVIFICLIGVLYTPIGDWWYRKIILNLREPNSVEKEKIIPIYNEVYKKALSEVPNLSKNIQLFIYDDDDINAFAIGLKTIAVHKGLLSNSIYDGEIAAILGHEFAHIANGDTFCTILAIQSNIIVSIVRNIFSFFMFITAKLFGFITALIVSFDTIQGAKDGFDVADALVRLINWLINKFVSIFVFISVIIAQYSRRKHELAADTFAAKLGYAEPMLHFFQRYKEVENSRDIFNLAYLLNGTHPSMQKRILNLQNIINTKN